MQIVDQYIMIINDSFTESNAFLSAGVGSLPVHCIISVCIPILVDRYTPDRNVEAHIWEESSETDHVLRLLGRWRGYTNEDSIDYRRVWR